MIKYFLYIFIFTGFLNGAELTTESNKYFANGFNVIVESNINDASEARVFFKDHKSPNYQLYVKMACNNNHCYAKLPLPKIDLLSFDYTLAYKDLTGVLHSSKIYTTTKRDLLIIPSWQKKYYKEKVQLYTELEEIPKYVRGIGDKLDIKATKKDDIWGKELNFYNKPKKKTGNCLINLWGNLLSCLNIDSIESTED